MPYHKVRNDGTIHIESDSPKAILFYTGLGFLIATQGPWLLLLSGSSFSLGAKIIGIVGLFFSLIIFIPSFFLKPIFTVFDRKAGRVYFHSGKWNFDVPFSAIVFEGAGTASATYRMRYHEVTIYAFSNEPLFPGQKITNPDQPATYYKTYLGTYKCRSREQAEESIEQLLRFMGSLPPESAESSKFNLRI